MSDSENVVMSYYSASMIAPEDIKTAMTPMYRFAAAPEQLLKMESALTDFAEDPKALFIFADMDINGRGTTVYIAVVTTDKETGVPTLVADWMALQYGDKYSETHEELRGGAIDAYVERTTEDA